MEDNQRYRYSFGTAEFDESRFELRVGGVPATKVERKPLELLLVLLRYGGETVSREELANRLWPGASDTRQVLDNAVAKLRRALGDKASVVTQRGLGCRLAYKPNRVAIGRGYEAQRVAELRARIQEAYSALNEVEAAIAAGRLAVEAAVHAGGPESQLTLSARLKLASDLGRGGHYEEAHAVVAQTASDLTLSGQKRHGDWAQVWCVRSDLEAYQLLLPEALASARRALNILEDGSQVDTRVGDVVRYRFANALRMAGHHADSERAFRKLVAEQERRGDTEEAVILQSRLGLAKSVMLQEKTDEALAITRDAAARIAAQLGEENLVTQQARDALASVQFKMQDYDSAAQTWQDIADVVAHLLPRPTDLLASVLANVGLALLYAGHLTESEAAGRRALDFANALFAYDSPRIQSIRYQLAFSLLDQRKTQDVAGLLEGLTPSALKQSIQANDWEARISYQRGRLAFLLSDSDSALRYFLFAEPLLVANDSQGLVSVALIRSWIGRAREAGGFRNS
jgi:DNA-binding winged helix-turn-helix (wHTH) protein